MKIGFNEATALRCEGQSLMADLEMCEKYGFDYFEIRYENPAENRRCFYQLEGEGIRYELVSFVRSIELGTSDSYIDQAVTAGITRVVEAFYSGEKLRRICLKSVPCRQEA